MSQYLIILLLFVLIISLLCKYCFVQGSDTTKTPPPIAADRNENEIIRKWLTEEEGKELEQMYTTSSHHVYEGGVNMAGVPPHHHHQQQEYKRSHYSPVAIPPPPAPSPHMSVPDSNVILPMHMLPHPQPERRLRRKRSAELESTIMTEAGRPFYDPQEYHVVGSLVNSSSSSSLHRPPPLPLFALRTASCHQLQQHQQGMTPTYRYVTLQNNNRVPVYVLTSSNQFIDCSSDKGCRELPEGSIVKVPHICKKTIWRVKINSI